jgi:uncharacterized membrane protein (DUF485 family)
LNQPASDAESRKQSASLAFAAALALLLAVFAGLRVLAINWLSRIVLPGVSRYTALMILLSVAAWLLTWAYIVRIERIETEGNRAPHEDPRT